MKKMSSKITIETIRAMKSRGEKIAALTAYDFPMAKLLDEAGVPLLLVGDSLGMVVLGYPDTTHVTMAEMEHHVRAAARAKPNALLGADLPFKSYDTPEQAVENSKRLDAVGAEFVKAEGGREILPQVKAIIAAGIPVLRPSGDVAAACSGRRRLPHQRQKRCGTPAVTARRKAFGRHRRVCRRAGTGHAAGREGNLRNDFHSHHRHRQRAGLRRADSGNAGFDRRIPVVHATIREAAGELRGNNQIGGGRVEEFARKSLMPAWFDRSAEHRLGELKIVLTVPSRRPALRFEKTFRRRRCWIKEVKWNWTH